MLLCFALGLLGCERGCLGKALEEKRRDLEAPALDLGGTDCPADVFRCRDGHVERGLGGHVPASCQRGEGCTCPFVPEAECARGCLLEDTVLALADGGMALCATGEARSVPVVGPADPCDGDDVICKHGAIVRCAPSPRTIARCLRGCSGEGALDPDVPERAYDTLCAP